MRLTDTRIREFREKVYQHYHQHGRSFPWRNPSDPYEILVSEVMLQQTQADRVVGYYERWLEAFPDIAALAKARLPRVLKLWQGLGYNRRALMLKKTAEVVRQDHQGKLPDTEPELMKLPGIGPYTAAAIAAFAGNRPTVVIETNIRSVFIHEFLGGQEGIDDKELVPLIAKTVDPENPREWYQALMDYGAMLKKSGINPSRRSKHYVRQSTFQGSNRQIRGQVLRLLAARAETKGRLKRLVETDSGTLDKVIRQLKQEGFIDERDQKLRLAQKITQ